MEWPQGWKPKSLDAFVKKNGGEAPTSATHRRNIAAAEAHMRKRGLDPRRVAAIVDIGTGRRGVVNYKVDACPTITATRGYGRAYWLTTRKSLAPNSMFQ